LAALDDDKCSINAIIQALVDQESQVGEPEPKLSASTYATCPKFNMDGIECHNCHQLGHFVNKCLQPVQGGDRLATAMENLTTTLCDYKSPSAMSAKITMVDTNELEFSRSPHIF
jgi:hypothetical protein